MGKDFVDKRSQINEGFKDEDLDKVFQLICSSLNKHLKHHLIALNGMENVKVDGEYMRTKYMIYKSQLFYLLF